MLHSPTASSANGPTLLGPFLTLKTCFNHSRMLSGSNSYHPSLAKLHSAIRTGISWRYRYVLEGCQSMAHNNTSVKITAPLIALILQQSHILPPEAKDEQLRARTDSRTLRRQRESSAASDLKERLPRNLQRALEISTEKGASSWLSTLPITEHGFALHKGAFRDALCLRYGWCPSRLPTHCICGGQFTVEHALSCSRGGFPSIRHNEIRDITAELLSEVCHSVGTEPELQHVTEEQLTHRSANREDGARLDIVATNFWGRDRQRAFFDVWTPWTWPAPKVGSHARTN